VNYYNEFDPKAAAWLRELIKAEVIPLGEVDERSIVEVKASDLAGYTQCHFFAGIGGWAEALRLAGFPSTRSVWTASLPCQPFSAAGKQLGVEDERHLWPVFFDLVKECKPDLIVGEQVARAIGFNWLDGIRADLEGADYTLGAAVLGAHSVGAPHKRQRLYWLAYTSGTGTGRHTGSASFAEREGGGQGISDGVQVSDAPVFSGADDSVAKSQRDAGEPRRTPVESAEGAGEAGERSSVQSGRCGLSHGDAQGVTVCPRLEGHSGDGDGGRESRRERQDEVRSTAETGGPRALDDSAGDGTSDGRLSPEQGSNRPDNGLPRQAGHWDSAIWLVCLDGKARRVEPSIQPLAHGVQGRVALLRGAGNAIVPQVAAAFVSAFLEIESQK